MKNFYQNFKTVVDRLAMIESYLSANYVDDTEPIGEELEWLKDEVENLTNANVRAQRLISGLSNSVKELEECCKQTKDRRNQSNQRRLL